MTRRLHAVRDGKVLERNWENDSRWDGITRDYTAEDVRRLRGSIDIEYTLAEMLQQSEFAAEAHGYTATRHQHEVGTAYFDEVVKVISAGQSSTTALEGSTEAAQF